jgi:demethylmenaquinone methyltransferase/2-methoxy-6-polyprenyl-1,4-benzoquinol methylase
MNTAIRAIFDDIPRTYELVNHLLTLGLDLPLRRYAAKTGVVRDSSFRARGKWLDVCTGTGDMARMFSRYAGPETLLVAADFSLPMLRYAANSNRHIQAAVSDAGRLAFPDNTFDRVTITFATRNINTSRTHLERCLGEFYRVLRPGGVFVNLETSQPDNALIRRLVHLYVRAVVRPMGGLVSGNDTAYRYLSQTIPRFYDAATLSRIIRSAGFAEVAYKPLVMGIAAVHWAVK